LQHDMVIGILNLAPQVNYTSEKVCSNN